MAVRKFKPVTAGTRHKIIGTYEEITRTAPEKSLLSPKKSTGGRNNTGKMTVRYIGGGHKQMYRVIDFKRTKDMPAVVKSIEYDPNRSARIALICYADGQKSYILAPNGLKVGQTVLIQKRLHHLLVSRATVGADAQGLAVFLNIEKEGGSTLGVTGGMQAKDLGVTESDHVTVMQVDVGQKSLEIAIILLKHIYLRAAARDDARHAVRMIAVTVREQDHLDILHVIAENGQRIDDNIGGIAVADVDEDQAVARIDHV